MDCPYCGSHMAYLCGEYGNYYSCEAWPDCDARVGAHADGRPLGRPAREELRHWRKAAHEVFDLLWKGAPHSKRPRISRTQAYQWLERATGTAHIAETKSPQECFNIIQACLNRTLETRRNPECT